MHSSWTRYTYLSLHHIPSQQRWNLCDHVFIHDKDRHERYSQYYKQGCSFCNLYWGIMTFVVSFLSNYISVKSGAIRAAQSARSFETYLFSWRKRVEAPVVHRCGPPQAQPDCSDYGTSGRDLYKVRTNGRPCLGGCRGDRGRFQQVQRHSQLISLNNLYLAFLDTSFWVFREWPQKCNFGSANKGLPKHVLKYAFFGVFCSIYD